MTKIIVPKTHIHVKTLKTPIKSLKSNLSKWHENRYGDGNGTEETENNKPQTSNRIHETSSVSSTIGGEEGRDGVGCPHPRPGGPGACVQSMMAVAIHLGMEPVLKPYKNKYALCILLTYYNL